MSGGYSQAPFGAFPFGMAASETEVVNWEPSLDSQIPRLAAIEFDVVNGSWDSTVRRVQAVFGNGSTEVVWTEQSQFTEQYKRGSSCKRHDDGYHFALRRTTGWIGALVRVDVDVRDEPDELPVTPPLTLPNDVVGITVEGKLLIWHGLIVINQPKAQVIPEGLAAMTIGEMVLTGGGSIITVPMEE